MTGDGFLIKIVPPGGYDVYRVHLSRRAVFGAAVAALALVFGALGVHAWQLNAADAAVRTLQAQASAQQDQIVAVDRQADALSAQLRALQRENAEIRRMIGVPGQKPSPHPSHAAVSVPRPDLTAVRTRLARLAAASRATAQDERRLSGLAHRVLNLRRLAGIARARLIAALPSINPVDGAIAAGYGYRTLPWPEFHHGVDLEADYGAPVHAAADGTVVATGWEGGFGIKVDVDHGNGYHSWYAHLSRVAVTVGEHVTKGQTIAAVGATGDATGPHLHYQLMKDGAPIDPAPYLAGIPPSVMALLPDPNRVQ